MDFLKNYKNHVDERANIGIPPLALDVEKTKELISLLKSKDEKKCKIMSTLKSLFLSKECGSKDELLELLKNRINPGVDDAAKVKAEFLNEILNHDLEIENISKDDAINMLKTMLGGYNVIVLISCLSSKDKNVARAAAEALKEIIFVHDYFNDVANLAKSGNEYAKSVIESWAKAEWFLNKPEISEKIEAVVFKVPGETNTDDLSPASEAFSRSDIPLHANVMLTRRQLGSIEKIKELKKSGKEVVYVGDVVGTGSSRKSGINSVQWHLGRDIEGVPNKKTGGIIIGSTIAPIFFNTAQDSGALPIIADVSNLETGDMIEIYPKKGEILKNGEVVSTFTLIPNTIFDEVRAGGRIPLIIGKSLCHKSREFLGLESEDIFIKPQQPQNDETKGYT